ncbi:HNH endonuclease [Serratia ureilytica]|uniref:HNH endonuclease n=1 Tax=Serratia ureilytica TaxID=300181 RepID=UPI0018AAE7AE|nr:HNH endonuclease [Serratia ureilytica]QWU37819.1 HNH endonuclease [Serratia ureilytica]
MIEYERNGTRFSTTASGRYSYQVWKTNHYAFGHYAGGCWVTKHSGMYSANGSGYRATADFWGTKLTGYTDAEWLELVSASDALMFTLHIGELQVYFFDNNGQKIVVKGDDVGRRQVRGALERLAKKRGKELPKSKEEAKAARRAAAVARTQKLMANSDPIAGTAAMLSPVESLKTLPIAEQVNVAPELKRGLETWELANYRAWSSENHSKLIGVKMIEAIATYRTETTAASKAAVTIVTSAMESIAELVAKTATEQPAMVSSVERLGETWGATIRIRKQHSKTTGKLRKPLLNANKEFVSKKPITDLVAVTPEKAAGGIVPEEKKALTVSNNLVLATAVANKQEPQTEQPVEPITGAPIANKTYSKTPEVRAGLLPEQVPAFRRWAKDLRGLFKSAPLSAQIEAFLVGGKAEDWEIVLSDELEHIAESVIFHDAHVFAYRHNRANRIKALRRVTVREGQGRFRTAVLANHNGCSITGLKDCVEAAHILPVAMVEDMRPGNGLALVSWLHAAFDALAFSIEPVGLTIHVAPQARQWLNIDGLQLVDGKIWPLDRSALAHHFERFKEAGIKP